MPSPHYLLWAEGIGKSFGGVQVLKSASVWAEAGKVTTLLGRNGSGKTTLLRIAAGVLRADHGAVSFLGDVREKQSLSRMARAGLMYIPQEQFLSPAYRVRDHVQALEATFPCPGIREVLADAGLETLLEQRVRSLSGGERTRLSLALALARRPLVLIADEPLVGLAPGDQEMLGNALRAAARTGVAVVTCGHDIRVLLSVSDAIIWSVAGTTHHLGSPAQALTHQQFRREYLGPAWT